MTKRVSDDDLKGVTGGGPTPRSSFETREPDAQVPVGKPGSEGGGVGNIGLDGEAGGGGGMSELG